MIRRRAILLAARAAAALGAPAAAHSVLVRAEPGRNATVTRPPGRVRLWFSERIEPAFSSVRVVNETGQRVDKEDSTVAPSAPKQLRVSLLPLSAGTYRVHWRVLSVDTHVTEGDFTFRVAP